MPPRKRCRTCAARRAAATTPELPANLLLEIAARSDAATIFRCAATCKLLRREILSPDFIHRVTGGPDAAAVPSRVLGVVGGERGLFLPRASGDGGHTDLREAPPGALRVARRRWAPRAVRAPDVAPRHQLAAEVGAQPVGLVRVRPHD
ncbi:hypothetical protein SETIT_9G026000v2 [Setaria italica]|uniref:F-box domain-containing protein n=1 Tax=Setaria italica TaxID=4555 RepID=A0A368SCN6_SETIT|nr:hypothetical protein SETIT_9G026000v2 [Setaria italica]